MDIGADGGSAFPGPDARCTTHGMTLRDWFAGQALAGCHDALAWSSLPDDYDNTAKRAYQLADAMLEARKQ